MTAKNFEKSTFSEKVFTIALALPVIALSTILAMHPVQAQNRNNVIFNGDFESGNIQGWGSEGCCSHSHTTVTSPVRAGSFAYRSLLKPTDRERAEIKLTAFPRNAERWVGVSMYIPSSMSNSGKCLFQFTRNPGGGRPYDAAFQLSSENGRLKIRRYWTGTIGTYANNQDWDLGPIKYDTWMDFVYHYKGSPSSSGVFEVWVNGVQKVNYQGPTEHARNDGPYIKMGVYVGGGNRVDQETSVYYDSFRIGNENARYEDVAPIASQPPTSPPVPPTNNQQKVFEDFSSSASKFTVELGGSWSNSSGQYLLSDVEKVFGYANSNISVHQTPLAEKFTLTADASAVATSDSWDDFSVIFNYQDSENYYYVGFNENNSNLVNGIYKVEAGTLSKIASFSSVITPQTTYSIKVEKAGANISVYRNSVLQGTASDSTFSGGKAGFGSSRSPATFDNMRVE